MNFEILLGVKSFQKPQFLSVLILFKVSPSRPSFIFVLFIPSSNVVRGYFHVSLNLAAVLSV